MNAELGASVREVAEHVAVRLHVIRLEDWYDVARRHLKLFRRDFPLLRRYHTIESLVTAAYPDHAWDYERFAGNSRRRVTSSQFFCERVVRSIFPDAKIERNVRAGLGLMGHARLPLEVDVYLPEYSLGFEYQDPYHYFTPSYPQTVAELKERDQHKQLVSAQKGITIINIPFWWDWNVDSLVATIKSKRTDLLPDKTTSAEPISEHPPPHVVEKWNYEIPDLGVPMLALLSSSTKSFNPTNWWLFEKYDGVRAIWHPKNRVMYSRFGTPLHLPCYIVDSFPPQLWFDGELWFGREKHTRYQALKISSSHSVNIKAAWDKFKYMAFDCPLPELREDSYEKRYYYMSAACAHGHPFVNVAPFELIKNKDMVETRFFSIRDAAGEGIIMRDPTAPYVNGYSKYLYKHKGFKDAEGLVLKKNGPNSFLCRVYKLNLTHNIDPSIDLEKVSNDYFDLIMPLDNHFEGEGSDVAPGKFVSFKYVGELASGAPVNPRIYMVRHDIQNWHQLLQSKRKKIVTERVWKPSAVQDWKDPKSHRAYFDKLAKDRGFDPLVPSNWYSMLQKDLDGKPTFIDMYYEGSIVKALTNIYPDIGLIVHKFDKVPRYYWSDPENRKKVFDEYAQSRGFDPLVAENWYHLKRNDIINIKETAITGFSILDALQNAYPFVAFDRNKFFAIHGPKVQWEIKENRRKFFDDYAASKGLDPLVPEIWYSLKRESVYKRKGAETILRIYGGSLSSALMDVYKDLNLDETKFQQKLGTIT